MPPKGKSKNTAKGKGRGQGRPVLRAPSPFAVSGTEKDPAAQKTEPDTAEVHDPQDACLKPEALKARARAMQVAPVIWFLMQDVRA